jgi:hypothetical protein
MGGNCTNGVVVGYLFLLRNEVRKKSNNIMPVREMSNKNSIKQHYKKLTFLIIRVDGAARKPT